MLEFQTLHPMHRGKPKPRFVSLFCGIAPDFVYGKTSRLQLRNVAFQQTLGSCHETDGLQSSPLLMNLCDVLLKKGDLLPEAGERTYQRRAAMGQGNVPFLFVNALTSAAMRSRT